MPAGAVAAAVQGAKAAKRASALAKAKNAQDTQAQYSAHPLGGQAPDGDDLATASFGTPPNKRLSSTQVLDGALEEIAAKAGARSKVWKFINNNNTFWVLSPTNPLRKLCLRVAASSQFDSFILLFITLNCGFLAADDPTCVGPCEDTSKLKQVLATGELVFTAVFSVELVTKVIAQGFFFGHNPYMRSPWNWLDFICVVTSYSFLMPGAGGNVSGLRAFRALRPLRTINGVPGMRLLVNTLIESIPLMIDVMVLIVWMFFVFGIIGMNFFMGKMRGRCVEVDAATGVLGGIPAGMENQVCALPGSGGPYKCPEVCSDDGSFCTQTTCVEMVPGSPILGGLSPNPNGGYTTFDTFLWACLNIFHCLTCQGWATDQMYPVYDAVGVISILYFTCLIIFGTFFTLNLLTAIISAKFGQLNETMKDEGAFNDDEEDEKGGEVRNASALQRIGFFIKGKTSTGLPKEPSRFQKSMRKIIDNTTFNNVVTFCILLNTAAMAIEHHGMDPTLKDVLQYIDYVLFGVFSIELLLKHLGLGLWGYWSVGFNVLDGVTVVVSIIEVTSGGESSGLSSLRALRLLRILRSMKLLKQFKELARLMSMVLRGFIALKDFMLLMTLFIFIFALLGMNLFGGSEEFDSDHTWAYRKNFNSIWEAAYTVFEILTGANWFIIMWNGMRAQGTWASLYFVLWTVIGNFVLLTLFLAILIANFSEEDEEEEDDVKAITAADGVGDALQKPKKPPPRPPNAEEAMEEVHRIKLFLVSIGETYGIEDDDLPDLQKEVARGALNKEAPNKEAKKAASPRPDSPVFDDLSPRGTSYEPDEPPPGPGSTGRESSDEHASLDPLEDPLESEAVGPSPRAPLADLLDRPQPKADPEEEGRPASPDISALISEEGESSEAVVDALLQRDYSSGKPGGEDLFSTFSEMPETLLQPYGRGGPAGERSAEGISAGPGPVTEALLKPDSEMGEATGEEQNADDIVQGLLDPGGAREGALDTSALEAEENSREHLKSSSLFIMSGTNKFRLMLTSIASAKWFEFLILFVILFSSVTLAMDSPSVDPDSRLREILNVCDLIFTIIFTIELLVKVLAFGFILHRGSYMRNSWNVLDFIIVVSSLMSLAFDSESLSIMKSFRLMRALRPLRMVSRMKGMQIVVTCLIKSMPAVINVVMFGGFQFLVFGILGVQLFGGKFYKCNDMKIEDSLGNQVLLTHRANCTGTFVCEPGDICENVGEVYDRRWENSFLNFDNLGEAIISLFIVTTMDDWMRISYGCMDAVGVDRQPIENNAPYMALYVFIFVFLGALFWVNLLVGVIIDNYNQIVSDMGSENLLTDSQKQWLDVLKLRAIGKQGDKKKDLPENPIRRALFKIVMHPVFEYTIMGCILLNVLVLACTYYDQGETYELVLKIFNFTFTVVFLCEATLKIIALKPLPYWEDHWNKFDLFICLASIPDFFLEKGGFATAVRIFRIGRMFKLVQGAKGLRTLFNTLLQSLPAVWNVGSLLFLLLCVYGVLGMNLFGKPGLIIYDVPHANFNTFGMSLNTLFRVFSGDSWSLVMEHADECKLHGGCKRGAHLLMTAFYFITFIILAAFVMLNLVIAVIIDKFVASAESEGLLQSDNFFDMIQKKMLIDRFVDALTDHIAGLMVNKYKDTKTGVPKRSSVAVLRSLSIKATAAAKMSKGTFKAS